jgi:hypothetical protein
MLLGAARDEGEARNYMLQSGDNGDLAIQATNGETLPAPQLYLAVESDEEDDSAARAMDTLANAVFELQVVEQVWHSLEMNV